METGKPLKTPDGLVIKRMADLALLTNIEIDLLLGEEDEREATQPPSTR